MIATWKLPTSKVYHGLNNALGICVNKKTLPSFAHPDGTDICSGPWTNLFLRGLKLNHVCKIGPRWFRRTDTGMQS